MTGEEGGDIEAEGVDTISQHSKQVSNTTAEQAPNIRPGKTPEQGCHTDSICQGVPQINTCEHVYDLILSYLMLLW